MQMRRRDFAGWLLAAPFTVKSALGATAEEQQSLSYYKEARIDWRQAAGQSLSIGLNKHPFTESLLPLIPAFRSLTGIEVDYLILPEAEYFTQLRGRSIAAARRILRRYDRADAELAICSSELDFATRRFAQ